MLDAKPCTEQAETVSATESPLRSLPAVQRISSQELMRQARELEIDHQGKIYRLRITQLNKLILTA